MADKYSFQEGQYVNVIFHLLDQNLSSSENEYLDALKELEGQRARYAAWKGMYESRLEHPSAAMDIQRLQSKVLRSKERLEYAQEMRKFAVKVFFSESSDA